MISEAKVQAPDLSQRVLGVDPVTNNLYVGQRISLKFVKEGIELAFTLEIGSPMTVDYADIALQRVLDEAPAELIQGKTITLQSSES